MPSEIYAHSDGHLLADHLRKVGHLACQFAHEIDANSAHFAQLAGQWHDLGKYRAGFQKYLRQSSDPDAHIEGKVFGSEKTHSIAGAKWAFQHLSERDGVRGELSARVLSYMIASHHTGLYDWHGDAGLEMRLAKSESQIELSEALEAAPPNEVLQAKDAALDLSAIPGGIAGFALWVRLLFSCLVDADFLDTEAHFDKGKGQRREGFPSLGELLTAFDAHITELSARAVASPVNTLRAEVLQQCRTTAQSSPGPFSLTVPTGGGKTLSSLAFALEHAKAHNKRRIVYAIPYTSIIEQTAEVFRKVFKDLGEEVIVEHHSQIDVDEKDETARSRLASENWDAPLIVTTNVQLFESLFAAKTSRCRKLHNLINSVIILDEAQQLPTEFLQPILHTLNLLTRHYGVTVVLCTATQPDLRSKQHFDAARNMQGFDNVREIIDDPLKLYGALKRVNIQLPVDWRTPMPYEEIAKPLLEEGCVLTIVNTREAARKLSALLPDSLHLSTRMCGQHRADTLAEVKRRLDERRAGRDSRPLRVVSTQLVEAGVDLDFPVVWRAFAGLDSIAQAAGRCNRDGRFAEKGRVLVFIPPEALPAGAIRRGGEASRSVLHGFGEDPLTPSLLTQYFEQFYRSSTLDAKGICGLLKLNPSNPKRDDALIEAVFSQKLPEHLIDKARNSLGDCTAISFRSAANDFQLIDEKDLVPVVIPYGDKRADVVQWANIARKDGPQKRLMRKLQRYIVNVRKREAEALLGRGINLISPGLYLVEAENLYDIKTGLRIDNDSLFNPTGNIF